MVLRDLLSPGEDAEAEAAPPPCPTWGANGNASGIDGPEVKRRENCEMLQRDLYAANVIATNVSSRRTSPRDAFFERSFRAARPPFKNLSSAPHAWRYRMRGGLGMIDEAAVRPGPRTGFCAAPDVPANLRGLRATGLDPPPPRGPVNRLRVAGLASLFPRDFPGERRRRRFSQLRMPESENFPSDRYIDAKSCKIIISAGRGNGCSEFRQRL